MCPESEEEEDAFDELEDLVSTNRLSAAVGWAIQLRNVAEWRLDKGAEKSFMAPFAVVQQ